MDKDKVLSIAGRILIISFIGGLLAFISWIWIGGDFLIKTGKTFATLFVMALGVGIVLLSQEKEEKE
tara:strand:+ start:384 stop:584 length:201 start_codon:yes stop_codon:yes gene_type:complete